MVRPYARRACVSLSAGSCETSSVIQRKTGVQHSWTPARIGLWIENPARLLPSFYDAGLTVTSNASLTWLPSLSFAVTVMVAVPSPVPNTVRVEPSSHMEATA